MLWAVHFYPTLWLQRYGDEFVATVEDMPAPGWAVVWNVWKGAIMMQINFGGSVNRLVAFSLVGLALAWGLSWLIPDLYVSEATIRSSGQSEPLQQSLRAVLGRPRLAVLIEKHQLYGSERARLPLEDIVEKMKNNIHVSPVGKDPAKPAFAVGFAYEDGAVAQRVTADLVAALTQLGQHSVLDAASNPSPIYPNRPVFAFTGLLAGGLLGLTGVGVTSAARKRRHA